MGRKDLNPADVYRKAQRKKELKKCKENRIVVKSVQELLSDPNKIEEEIQIAQKAADSSKLDKGLKDRVKELKMMKTVALTKQKINIASGKTERDNAAKLKEEQLLQRSEGRSSYEPASSSSSSDTTTSSSTQQNPYLPSNPTQLDQFQPPPQPQFTPLPPPPNQFRQPPPPPPGPRTVPMPGIFQPPTFRWVRVRV
jgi:hypothetical protein